MPNATIAHNDNSPDTPRASYLPLPRRWDASRVFYFQCPCCGLYEVFALTEVEVRVQAAKFERHYLACAQAHQLLGLTPRATDGVE